jgi:hypothetical protein
MSTASEIRKISAEMEFIQEQIPDEKKGIADYKKAMKFDDHLYKWLSSQEAHHLKALKKRMECLQKKANKLYEGK